ncbi:MAG: hypothetical protein ACK41T_08540 [Pseudobdellovibrio sp.]
MFFLEFNKDFIQKKQSLSGVKSIVNIYHFFVCMSLFFFLSCTKVGLGYKYVSNEVKDKIQESFDFNAKKEKEINAFLDENFSSRKKDFLIELKGYVIKLQKISDVKELTLEKVDEVATDFSLLQKNIINLYKISFEKVVYSVENSEKENFIRYSNENISEMLEKSKNKEAFIKTKIKNFHRAVFFLLDTLMSNKKSR